MESPPGTPPQTTSAPRAKPHPWRDDPPLPYLAVPPGNYGYLIEGEAQTSNRDGLARHLARHPWTEAAYHPDALGPVRPEMVPGLLYDYRAALVRAARKDVAIAAAFMAAALAWLAAWWEEAGTRSLPGLLAVFAGVSLLMSVHALYHARRVRPDAWIQARQSHRHWAWVRAQPAVFTWALVVPLALICLLTFLDDERAVRGAGLVKPAVWDGQVWRMLTGPMLHTEIYHAWLNLGALFALGRIVETHTSRFYLSAVLLLSVLGGSVLSLLLLPMPSIGVSGGVMGLVGFLWMLARLHPRELPDEFANQMKYAVGATAVLGLLGLQFIDNFAHLGGLLAGAGVGWLTLRERIERENPRIVAAGVVALLVLWAAMIGTVAAIWSAPY